MWLKALKKGCIHVSFTSEAVKARNTYECGKRQPFPTQGLEETAVTHLGLPVPAVPVTQRTRWTVQYTLLSIQKIQYVCYIHRIRVWQKLQHIPSSACSSCNTTNLMVCKWSRSSKASGLLPVWYEYAANNLDNSEKTVCCKVCNDSVFANDPDHPKRPAFCK